MLNTKSGVILVFKFALLSSFLHAAPDYPDLIELDMPEGSIHQNSAAKKTAEPEIVPQAFEKENSTPQMSLEHLEKALQNSNGLKDEEKLRLLSLLEEMQGRYDSSYLTFKAIKGQSQKDWYLLRELLLSEKLGLEDDILKSLAQLDARYRREVLKIKKVVLCTSIKSFGQYDPIPQQALPLRKSALIYVEFTGLTHYQKSKGEYQMSFNGSFDILDTNGKLLYTEKLKKNKEGYTITTKSKMKDFFIWTAWRPTVFRPGEYDMVVRLSENANVIDSKTHRFKIL